MPSFDVVNKTDMQEVDNAVNSVLREVGTRYDFKGSNTSVNREEEEVTILADDQYKLEQVQGMLKAHFVKRGIDAKALDFGKTEQASGNSLRQKVKVTQGIASDIAKHIVKEVKAQKMKVQVSIRGEELRVEGKKKDDLQGAISFIKGLSLTVPVQFVNFRD